MPTLSNSSDSLVVKVGVQCHVGKQRTENQDRVTRAATPFGELFVVADGMGGYQGGAEAAQATVDGFVGYLNAHGSLPLHDALQQAAGSISAELQQRSAAEPALHGIGSTVVLCIVDGLHVTYAHAGDSRAYLLRHGQLQQLTRDHSVMERLMAQGVLTGAQAQEHPDASVLTRAIGQSSDVSLDIAEIRLQPHDALLLCSDGLWGYAQPQEMEAVAASENLSASGVAAALLDLALEGGGGDNVSIQFLRFEPAIAGKSSGLILGMKRPAAFALLAFAAALAVATIGGAIFVYNHPIVKREPKPIAQPPLQQTPQPPVEQTPAGAESSGTGKPRPQASPAANKHGTTTPASPSKAPSETQHKPAETPQPTSEQPPAQPAEQPSPLHRIPQEADKGLGKATDAVTSGVKKAKEKLEEVEHQPKQKTSPTQSDQSPQTPPQDNQPQ